MKNPAVLGGRQMGAKVSMLVGARSGLVEKLVVFDHSPVSEPLDLRDLSWGCVTL